MENNQSLAKKICHSPIVYFKGEGLNKYKISEGKSFKMTEKGEEEVQYDDKSMNDAILGVYGQEISKEEYEKI